jgi:hypothetical protein
LDLGLLLTARREFGVARKSIEDAMATLQKLADDKGKEASYGELLAEAHFDLGYLHQTAGNLVEARGSYPRTRRPVWHGR